MKKIPFTIEKLKHWDAVFPMYHAILTDEGQDFAANWYQLLSLLFNPETKLILVGHLPKLSRKLQNFKY